MTLPKVESQPESRPLGEQELLLQVAVERDAYPFYRSPPSIELCKAHQQASRCDNEYNFLSIDDQHKLLESNDKSRICQCCHKFGSKKSLGICAPLSEVGKLGPFFRMYFEYGYCSALLSLVVLLFFGVYSMAIYVKTDTCHYSSAVKMTCTGEEPDTDCKRTYNPCGVAWKFYLSMANDQRPELDQVQDLLFFFVFFIVMGFQVALYMRMDTVAKQYDSDTLDITDFTVELRNLPADVCDHDIADYFAQLQLTDSRGEQLRAKVVAINYVFRNYDSLQTAFDKLLKLTGETRHAHATEVISRESERLQQALAADFTIHKDQKKRQRNFTGKAFVTFETEEQFKAVNSKGELGLLNNLLFKNIGIVFNCFTRKNTTSKHRLTDKKGYFVVIKATHPDELIWPNLGIRNSLALLLKLLAFVLMYGSSFITFIVISVFKSELKSSDEVSPALSVFYSTLIVVLNLITILLANISAQKIQRPVTKSELSSNIIWRSAIIMFMNSTLALTMATQEADEEGVDKKFWDEKGVASDLFMLMVTSFADLFLDYLDVAFIIKLLKRKLFKLNLRDSKLTQKEANTLFEGADFSISDRAPKYLYRIALAFFLLKGFPIAAAMNVILFLLFIYNDKLWLLKACKVPEKYSVEMIYDFIRFFDLVLIAFGLGGYQFVNEKVSAADGVWAEFWVCALAFFAYVTNFSYLLARQLIRFYKKPKFTQVSKSDGFEGNKQQKTSTFLLQKKLFNSTYEQSNPVSLMKRELESIRKFQTGK